MIAVVDIFLLTHLYYLATITTPKIGGTVVEGVLGVPRSFNPLFAERQSEHDIVALLHRGLTQYDIDKKEFVPALASSYSVSTDNLTYEFVLRDDLFFHDNQPVTVNDILFTIQHLKDTLSPLKKKWDDIRVEIIGNDTVRFTLPFAREFLSQTTLPILPSHVWNKIPIKESKHYQGIKALIGTGPFMINKHILHLNGLTSKMEFTPFRLFYKGGSFVHITLVFYQKTKDIAQAIAWGDVNAFAGASPLDLQSIYNADTQDIKVYLTTKVFAGFFNTKDGKILSDPFIRATLIANTDKEKLVESVFGEYAVPIYGPLPQINKRQTEFDELLDKKHMAIALQTHIPQKEKEDGKNEITKEGGSSLTLNVVIPNMEEAKKFTQQLKEQWSSLGISLNVRLFEPTEYSLARSTETDFDIFFYGYEAYTPEDLSQYWHSSNPESFSALSGYGNSKLNDMLSALQITTQDTDKDLLYTGIKDEFEKDSPAVFLYSPKYIYVVPKEIQLVGSPWVNDEVLRKPSDRYMYAHQWFLETKRIINIR